MGFRFRKSLKLAPGIRMNFSGSGPSLTVGPRGASVNFGKRGTYLNTGMPGTGLYSRTRIDGGSHTQGASSNNVIKAKVTVHIDDDGTISFKDENGNPAPDTWIALAKKQQGEQIKDLIQTECDKINAKVESLGELHLHTPDPSIPPEYIQSNFSEPKPHPPQVIVPGFFASLFKHSRWRIEHTNAVNEATYLAALKDWQDKQSDFNAKEAERKVLIEQKIYVNTDAMSDFLEANLHDIHWPKETNISFDIVEEGRRILLDVDLPEIEDMPTQVASVPSRGLKLNIKEMSVSQVQKLYMQHVHGVGFRIIGEAFSILPILQEIILSAYSQRPDSTTGKVRDDYLYSVRVNRNEWSMIQFNNLAAIDVVEAFSRFELHRDMSKTGIFKTINPITP